jgi:cysteine synthase
LSNVSRSRYNCREANVTHSVLETIGNTPVVKLRRVVPAGCGDVIVKLEYFNPTSDAAS